MNILSRSVVDTFDGSGYRQVSGRREINCGAQCLNDLEDLKYSSFLTLWDFSKLVACEERGSSPGSGWRCLWKAFGEISLELDHSEARGRMRVASGWCEVRKFILWSEILYQRAFGNGRKYVEEVLTIENICLLGKGLIRGTVWCEMWFIVFARSEALSRGSRSTVILLFRSRCCGRSCRY